MTRTAQLDLPLVMSAQAQKHVTVNESLVRLDAAAQLRVSSSQTSEPPSSSVEGTSYLVPANAEGEWLKQRGKIAVSSNGGWIYMAPKAGWRAWDEGHGGYTMFDGTAWIADALAVSAGGAAIRWNVVEFEHRVLPGATSPTSVVIPDQAQVYGVTGRVKESLKGAGLTGWRIGVEGAADRYGARLGLGLNSYLIGLSGSPVTYYSETPLLLSAEGGDFAGGVIQLAVSYLRLSPPRAV